MRIPSPVACIAFEATISTAHPSFARSIAAARQSLPMPREVQVSGALHSNEPLPSEQSAQYAQSFAAQAVA